MAIPNFSEGRDPATVRAISEALEAGEGVRLLDVHSDPDHHRSVYTLVGAPGALSDALLAGAERAGACIDVMREADGARDANVVRDADARAPRGEHPHVGALDVAPVVYLEEASRGAACAQALVIADRIGDELQIPVFLYGELAGGRTRAQLRSGGVAGLAGRMATGEIAPDFGPARLHPTAGATLVGARAPLVAFNLQLAPPADIADARRIAALIREGGPEGLPGVRAIGVRLTGEVAQVSMNVERPFEVPLALVLERVRAHAPVASAELVGLAPRAAFAGFPENVPMPGFDPAAHLIESALGRRSDIAPT